MNWKVFLTVGVVAGSVAVAARRWARRGVPDPAPWADATDPVSRFGDA
jgi:hypothetical protein